MVSKQESSLGKFIRNIKSKTINLQKSGVINFLVDHVICKVYVGQTGRSFAERIDDHECSYFKEDGKSNYANHVIDELRSFNSDLKILHQVEKSNRLNLLETLEINKLRFDNVLLNSQLDLNNSPLSNFKRSQSLATFNKQKSIK